MPMSPKLASRLKPPNGEYDARLRVIYSTTEPRAICCCGRFQRALYKDEAGRRITEPDRRAAVRR